MTSYLESVNAGSFYLIVALILGLMTVLCAVFLIKSYRAGIAIGMDPKVLKKTITSSAAFTLLPSVSILLGVIAGLLWKGLKKIKVHDNWAFPISAAIATICHTLLVMGSIYLLLAQQYAQAKNVAITAVFGLIMGTVTASGIPEAIVAAILVTVIGKALLHLMAQLKKR